jgi:uncharacterized membrane-anchored protein YitT (DUF2179 family)
VKNEVSAAFLTEKVTSEEGKIMKAVALAERIEFKKHRADFDAIRSIAVNIGLITLGSIVFVIGMDGILVPHEFISGGALGIALLAHYLVPSIGVGLAYLVVNIPLALLGWFNISRSFMVYTIFGILVFSVAAHVIHPTMPVIEDPILAALLAGVICGAGSGLILRSVGSAGGMDILGVYLNKKFGFRIGSIVFAANVSVLLAGAYLYDIQMALYSVIYLFTTGKVTDAILTGFNRRKAMMIISDHTAVIAEKILSCKGRGVTFLNGEGAFTGREKKVIFTITSLTELPKMKELVLSQDPNAFIVVNDTLEVLGKRHGTGRVY